MKTRQIATSGSLPRLVRPWTAGDKLLCIDDQGWLVPDPGFEHLIPQKGKTYTLREYTRETGVGAVSLMEGNPEHFYRSCRFKRSWLNR